MYLSELVSYKPIAASCEIDYSKLPTSRQAHVIWVCYVRPLNLEKPKVVEEVEAPLKKAA